MIFKSINLTSFNAVLLHPGEQQKPQREWIDYGKVPGSSVALYQDTGTYLPYERTIEILAKTPSEIPAIYAWLDGYGQLDMGDGGYYNARVLTVKKLTVAPKNGASGISAVFEIQPFLYLTSNNVTLTSGATVVNPGIESDPYFKITGTGSVTLTVNGAAYVINPIDQYIEIEYPYAWKGALNKGITISGFPKLKPGNNVISWTGTVTEVKMNGRWRKL